MNSVLFVAFFISNSLRVLFYLPQFFKFFKEENTLPSHSLFMWISWIVANLTVGIYFTIEVGLDEKAILSYMNSVMCILAQVSLFTKERSTRNHPTRMMAMALDLVKKFQILSVLSW